MAEKKAIYDESQIKHLDALEHIRLRSGMYIGRLGNGSNQNDGIYILLKEAIDNSVDEFIMGFGKKIEVSIENNRVKVRDYGRGIPLGKVVDCVSQINTGAKYNDDVFQFSVGMNGVGTKAVNALSAEFIVRSVREGKFCEARFIRGKLQEELNGEAAKGEKTGTYFEFVPDTEIFGKYAFNMEFVEKRIWNYAYLNSGLELICNGKSYKSENGLLDLLTAEMDGEKLYDVGFYSGDKLKFAFTHTINGDTNSNTESYFSYVNGQYTADGGTHLAAFKEGFLKGINAFFNKSYHSEDVRYGLNAALLVKVKDPVFESQTKNKLGNTDIRSWIVAETQAALDEWLHKNPDAAKIMQDKINANESFRTDLNSLRKKKLEATRKTQLKIDKLKDCRYHLGDGEKGADSMIFITEGDSATGSMVGSRDVSYQAIFSLRGKPENMFGKKQQDIYKNDELCNLMMALGIEKDDSVKDADSSYIDNLRYNKIIIATDADNDGFHIRNLVLTFFLTYYKELVTTGHVFILETPLFRVRNKKKTVYCYSEDERDKSLKKLGAGVEVTRFKGLGEISPNEFSQFIHEDMHLTPIEIQVMKNIPTLLEFYMGKNTPERREFIVNNLSDDIDA